MSDDPERTEQPPEFPQLEPGMVWAVGDGKTGAWAGVSFREKWEHPFPAVEKRQYPEWLHRFIPDDHQQQWEQDRDPLAHDVCNCLQDGQLDALLTYLKEASSPELNFKVRNALVTLLEGGPETRWRLTCVKHPDAPPYSKPASEERDRIGRIMHMIAAYHDAGGFRRGWSARGRFEAMKLTHDWAWAWPALQPLSDAGVQALLTRPLLSAWKPVSKRFDGQRLPMVHVLGKIGATFVPLPPPELLQELTGKSDAT